MAEPEVKRRGAPSSDASARHKSATRSIAIRIAGLPPVPGISEDKLDEGEEAACAPIEDEQSAVAILHSGRVDDDVQQQAERVDQDMPFAAGDLLGRIKALRVKRGAPF